MEKSSVKGTDVDCVPSGALEMYVFEIEVNINLGPQMSR